MIKKLIISIIFIAFTSIAFAHTDVDYTNLGKTIVYIDSVGGNSENGGTSWSDALDDTPSSFSRDTIYMYADGTGYTPRSVTTAESGAQYIYFVKATTDDHGTETGWSSSMGDGVASFSGRWILSYGYFVFDGQVGGGPGSWRTGHGFYIYNAATNYWIATAIDTTQRSNIEIHHLEGESIMDNSVEWIGLEMVNVDDLWVDHCWLHDVGSVVLRFRAASGYYQSSIVEYNLMENRWTSDPGLHGELIQHYPSGGALVGEIFRYNIFKDCMGTCMVSHGESSPGYDGDEYYGNVFYQSSDTYYTSNGMLGGDSGAVQDNYKVYNNTFINGYDSGGTLTQLAYWVVTGSGDVARNNIAWNTGGITADTKSHNLYNISGQQTGDADSSGQYYTGAISDLFNDTSFATNLDFTLKIATDAGYSLGSPYNEDPLGNTRGSDGNLDRGAHEYEELIQRLTVNGSGTFTIGGSGSMTP